MSSTRPLLDTPDGPQLAYALAPGEVHQLTLLAGQGLLIYDGSRVSHHSGPDEVAVDSLLGRINRLGAARAQRLVLWRQTPFDMAFRFSLRSFDYLPVTVDLGLHLQITDPEAFVRCYVGGSGCVESVVLRPHFFDALEHVLGKYLRKRSLDELVQDSQLDAAWRTLLRSELEALLAEAGLTLRDIQRLQLCHPAYEEARQQQQEIKLALENEQARQAEQAALDALYDEEEKAKIRRQELHSQLKIRQREQQLSEQEQAALQRERELQILTRVATAKTQEEALKLISADELAAVQHQLLGKRLEREMQAGEWQHLRDLANLRHQHEIELSQADHREALRDREREGKRKDQELHLAYLAKLVELDARWD